MNKKRILKGFLACTLASSLVGTVVHSTSALVDDSNLTDKTVKEPESWGATPNEAQIKYHEDELAAFMHFGMNTFTGKEWGDGTEDPATFNPTGDFAEYADSMVEALKNAGFKKLIVTAKHHDGFCIWPSQYTKHDVENSPYKNGKGDILAEISAACSKYDMDMGLYLSPWDVNAESYGYYDKDGNPLLDENGKPIDGMTMDEVKEKDELDYNDYYVNQIEEIVTNPKYGNKGHFTEWWMDGAKGAGGDAQEYDMERILKTIKDNEKGILIFGGGTEGGIHWIGNEKGQASDNTWAKVDSVKGDGYNEADGFTYGIPDGDHWSVPESDVSITAGWFYHDGDLPKSMSQLANIYFQTVGNGSPLLLNVPPNKTGDLDGSIYSRLNEFKNAISDTFKDNLLSSGSKASASSVYENALDYSPTKLIDGDENTYWTTEKGTNTGTIEIAFDGVKEFDVISIEEYITKGQRISSFDVEYQNESGAWMSYAEGKTIGAKKLLRQEPIKAKAIRIHINESYAEPMISEIGIYKTSKGFEKTQSLPDAYTKFVYGDKGLSFNPGSWNEDGQGNTGWHLQEDGSCTTTDAWANIKYSFDGTYFALVGTKGPNYGSFDIYIDGKYISSANCSASSETPGQLLYESPTLSAGNHTIQLTTGTNRKPVNFAYGYYLGTNEEGLFEIETDSYQVLEGDKMKVKIKRNGGAKGDVTVNVTTPPGTAVQGQYYKNITNETITFKDGEKTKFIELETYDNLDVTGNKDFYVEIFSPTGGAKIGMRSTARVLIIDDDKRLDDALKATSNISESWYKAEGWDEFNKAYLTAKEALENGELSEKEQIRLSNELMEAFGNLQAIKQYSSRNALVLPDNMSEEKILEPELGLLDSAQQNIIDNEYLKMVNSDNFSNGRLIDKIKEGNTITIPLKVEYAGTYNFDFAYKAAQPISLVIEGNGIEKQVIKLDASESLTNKSVAINLQNTGLNNIVISAMSTNKANGESLAIDNVKVTLATIAAPEVESIKIEKEPSKKIYNIGEELDLTGLKVTAKYDDGTTGDITDKVTIAGFDSSTIGDKTIKVHYGQLSDSFVITVKGKSDNVDNSGDNTNDNVDQDTPTDNTQNKPGISVDEDTNTSSQETSQVQTGDQQMILVFVAALVISGIAYITVKKVRKD